MRRRSDTKVNAGCSVSLAPLSGVNLLMRPPFFSLFSPQRFTVCLPRARYCTRYWGWKKSLWARHEPTTVRCTRVMPRFVPDALGCPGERTMGRVSGGQRPCPEGQLLTLLWELLTPFYLHPHSAPRMCSRHSSRLDPKGVLPACMTITLVQASSPGSCSCLLTGLPFTI